MFVKLAKTLATGTIPRYSYSKVGRLRAAFKGEFNYESS